MFRVRWQKRALDELTDLWVRGDARLRGAITAATYTIDQELQTDPFATSESRPQRRRVLFVNPLGITFRVEEDGHTVSVLKVWLFRKRSK